MNSLPKKGLNNMVLRPSYALKLKVKFKLLE